MHTTRPQPTSTEHRTTRWEDLNACPRWCTEPPGHPWIDPGQPDAYRTHRRHFGPVEVFTEQTPTSTTGKTGLFLRVDTELTPDQGDELARQLHAAATLARTLGGAQ